MNQMQPVTAKLLAWFNVNKRQLPWRNTRDPYRIWVAEVMLQQTRVDTVIPYYLAWLERFPTIQSLAHADVQDVLSIWEGLGYYSRARNFHQAAIQVVEKFQGKVPENYNDLISLPGIGSASAADILSISFNQSYAAVDGNIKRVVSRLEDIEAEYDSPKFNEQVSLIVNQLLPEQNAGDYNQAWMDLGASICLKDTPNCPLCPLVNDCLAYQNNSVNQRPVRKKKASIPHYEVTAGVIRRGGEVLIARRPLEGLLGGLWEFPGGKMEAGESLEGCLKRELLEELGIHVEVGQAIGKYRHAYTHFKVDLTAYECRIVSGEPSLLHHIELAWIPVSRMVGYPMGKIDRMIAGDLNHSDR